ncbi:hypothetical protein HanIR_Chr07g0308151 [Helianthus annuus]|nr:hypothetical protein HanIR_Chr07g0308151 [Helianthus annuus]
MWCLTFVVVGRIPITALPRRMEKHKDRWSKRLRWWTCVRDLRMRNLVQLQKSNRRHVTSLKIVCHHHFGGVVEALWLLRSNGVKFGVI